MIKVKWLAFTILSVILSQLISICVGSSVLYAQQVATIGKQSLPTQAKLTTSHQTAIEVKVETFRKQIIPGTALGVYADITNKSRATIYLRERDVHVILPPEVERSDVGQYSSDGWFPTEYGLDQPHVISLKPSETYRIFWNRSPDISVPPKKQSALSGIRQRFDFISFNPGVYPIMVEVKYWDQRNFSGDDYHTAIETKAVEFAAPQDIILLGAALGGLIFTFLGMVRADQAALSSVRAAGFVGLSKAVGMMGTTLVGSVLLSVIITILLSRIAETQFFVKVTVSDFWGAIAVGFLANYGGWALLEKMVPAGSKSRVTGTSSEKKAGVSGGGNGGSP